MTNRSVHIGACRLNNGFRVPVAPERGERGTRVCACRREDGFILLVVLVFVGLAAAMALALTLGLRGSGQDLDTELRSVQRRLALDSGLARMRLGIERGDDGFVDRNGIVLRHQAFVFDTMSIDLDIEMETGKLDVNLASPELLAGTLRALPGVQSMIRPLLERMADARAKGRSIVFVEDLLPVPERFSTIAGQIRTIITTGRDRGSVDLNEASPALIKSLPNISDSDRKALLNQGEPGRKNFEALSHVPIHDMSGMQAFRLVAQVTEGEQFLRREMILVFSSVDENLHVLSERSIPRTWATISASDQ